MLSGNTYGVWDARGRREWEPLLPPPRGVGEKGEREPVSGPAAAPWRRSGYLHRCAPSGELAQMALLCQPETRAIKLSVALTCRPRISPSQSGQRTPRGAGGICKPGSSLISLDCARSKPPFCIIDSVVTEPLHTEHCARSGGSVQSREIRRLLKGA